MGGADPAKRSGAACLEKGLIAFVFGNRMNVAPPLNLSDAEAAKARARATARYAA